MARSNEVIATEFAARLVAAMRAQGHVSGTAKSGVDVTALSKAAKTTYEMARRYVEGRAIPRPDKLERIAAWLRASPSDLLYGEPITKAGRIIHTEVLQRCVEAAREAERLAGKELPSEQMAKLVAFLYEEALDGREVSAGGVGRLLRLI